MTEDRGFLSKSTVTLKPGETQDFAFLASGSALPSDVVLEVTCSTADAGVATVQYVAEGHKVRFTGVSAGETTYDLKWAVTNQGSANLVDSFGHLPDGSILDGGLVVAETTTGGGSNSDSGSSTRKSGGGGGGCQMGLSGAALLALAGLSLLRRGK